LLDAHVSSRRIGRPLERRGHDVLALDRDAALAALDDEQVLALAAGEGRIVVTHNVRDFAPLLRAWGERGASHAGCILVTLPHAVFGRILRRLNALLARLPDQASWVDRAEFLSEEVS
jgi:predicted nuclease of predicted toxin-antitoxin system